MSSKTNSPTIKMTKAALSKARQRPTSAWCHFLRASMMDSDKDGGIKGKLTDRIRDFGTKWKAMPEEEKKPYIEKYMEAKQKSLEHKKNLSEEDKFQIQYWRRARKLAFAASGRTRTPSVYSKYIKANKEAFSSYTGPKKDKLPTVVRQLSQQWKSMTEEQKAVYRGDTPEPQPPGYFESTDHCPLGHTVEW